MCVWFDRHIQLVRRKLCRKIVYKPVKTQGIGTETNSLQRTFQCCLSCFSFLCVSSQAIKAIAAERAQTGVTKSKKDVQNDFLFRSTDSETTRVRASNRGRGYAHAANRLRLTDVESETATRRGDSVGPESQRDAGDSPSESRRHSLMMSLPCCCCCKRASWQSRRWFVALVSCGKSSRWNKAGELRGVRIC